MMIGHRSRRKAHTTFSAVLPAGAAQRSLRSSRSADNDGSMATVGAEASIMGRTAEAGFGRDRAAEEEAPQQMRAPGPRQISFPVERSQARRAGRSPQGVTSCRRSSSPSPRTRANRSRAGGLRLAEFCSTRGLGERFTVARGRSSRVASRRACGGGAGRGEACGRTVSRRGSARCAGTDFGANSGRAGAARRSTRGCSTRLGSACSMRGWLGAAEAPVAGCRRR